ncbi:hypothetical protein KGF56_004157 [Candida oxycetoniae]|uniref:MoaB/Mog domain-containing protein n=1 Tax=Candida oxycetoniae TaxID=497107 RepID=A0AAI9WWJ5_9ASCO|nr:uncharacterized protein KGF56_004157 [Candida oxycetoniae]KAI3403097.2 hypothetical protein KGF56_004157 [Candida oxycetoniae]
MSVTTQIKPIRTAGILIIGDEILNGKIQDTNSYNFARFCFNELSVPLKRILVCGDDSSDIKDALDMLLKEDKVDLLITSGGLGSTHDDITYEVLADYFDLDYKLNQQVVDKMQLLRKDYLSKLSSDQLNAYYRMATLPVAQDNSKISTNVLFLDEELWFPLLEIDQKVYVLPGIPQIFTQLLKYMAGFLKKRIVPADFCRRYVLTKSGESQLAPYLTNLQEKCSKEFGEGTVKLGSYPHMAMRVNTISIIGKDVKDKSKLDAIVKDIIDNIGGDAREISQEEENTLK